MRSFAVEGTVFWLIVGAAFGVAIAYYPRSPFLIPSIVVSIIYIGTAYMCWNLKVLSFIVATILAVFVCATDIVLSGFRYPGGKFSLSFNCWSCSSPIEGTEN